MTDWFFFFFCYSNVEQFFIIFDNTIKMFFNDYKWTVIKTKKHNFRAAWNTELGMLHILLDVFWNLWQRPKTISFFSTSIPFIEFLGRFLWKNRFKPKSHYVLTSSMLSEKVSFYTCAQSYSNYPQAIDSWWNASQSHPNGDFMWTRGQIVGLVVDMD